MDTAKSLYEQLTSAWKQNDVEACRPLLKKLRMALMELSYLPESGDKASDQELLLARETLEIGALWSIKARELPSFERYMTQLKAYYFDFGSRLPASAYMYELLGLNLLYLLTQHRVAEFHTEIERLDVELLSENPYIKHPVAMEQFIMEGAFNKVFLARENTPSQSYTFFVDILVEALRENIGECCAASYQSLSIDELKDMVFAPSREVALKLAEQNGWEVQGETIVFPRREKEAVRLESKKVMDMAIDVAQEIVAII